MNLTRRQFLTRTSSGIITVATWPLLSACGPATVPVATGPVMRQLGKFAANFLLNVGGEVVANEINEWRNQQNGSDQDDIDETNELLIEAGFNDFNGAEVWQAGAYSFYVVYSSIQGEEYNACMPCLPLGTQQLAVNMFEGPSFVILSNMAENYQELKGFNRSRVSDALLPYATGVHTPGRSQRFKSDFAFSYPTVLGEMQIAHQHLGQVEGGFKGRYEAMVDDGEDQIVLPGEYTFIT